MSRRTAAWCRRSSATNAFTLAALLSLPLGAAGSNGAAIALRVVVRGDGVVQSGTHICRSRCTWRVVRGRTRFAARAAMGSRFVRWTGACSTRRPSCTVGDKEGALVARFAHVTALVSWSSHTTCKPVPTTIPEILGSAENPNQGATEAGGRFQPHFRGGLQQHQLDPPCEIDGTPTFVEVDDVFISRAPNRSSDHDDSTNLTQAHRPDIVNPNMKTLHAEIDGTWIDSRVAPPFWPGKLGTRLDVQGFVFWDPAHLNDDWHQFSGWELHPVAAWRHSSR